MTESSIHRKNPLVNAVIIIIAVSVLYFSLTSLFLGALQHYSYMTAFVVDENWIKILIGYLAVVSAASFLPKTVEPRTIFLWMLFIIIVVPRFIVFGCHNGGWVYPFGCLAVFCIAAIIGMSFVPRQRKLDRVSRRNILIVNKAILAIVGVLAAVMFVYLVISKGIPTIAALDFNNIYEIRSSNSFPPGIRELLNLLGIYVLPLLVCYFLARGEMKKGVFISLVQLVFFLWMANKSWLLTLLLIWLVYFLLKKKKLTIVVLCVGVAVVMALLALWPNIYDSNLMTWIFSLFYRRLLLVPAALGEAYYDFFLSNPPVLFNGTILGFATPLPSQYETILYPNQVGMLAFGTLEGYANTGLFGGEFANFGSVLGWPIIAINLVIIIYLVTMNRNEGNTSFLTFASVFFAFSLLNASSTRLIFSYSGIATIALFLALLSSFTPAEDRKKSG